MARMKEPRRSRVLRRARAIAKAGDGSRMSMGDFCRALGIPHSTSVRELLEEHHHTDGRTLLEAAISDPADNIWTIPGNVDRQRILARHRRAKA